MRIHAQLRALAFGRIGAFNRDATASSSVVIIDVDRWLRAWDLESLMGDILARSPSLLPSPPAARRSMPLGPASPGSPRRFPPPSGSP